MVFVMKERKFIEPGWHKDLSNDDYHGSKGYSSSQVKKLIEKTPAHLKQSFLEKNKSTANMALGTAVHTLVLEPEKYDAEVAVMPEFNKRTNAGKAAFANFMDRNEGKTIINEDQAAQAKAMADNVLNHEYASILLQDCITEQSVYWWYKSMDVDDERKYKLMLKVRPDALSMSHNVIIDLKTCADASVDGFTRAIQHFYYHVSAAMYLEGVNQCKDLLQHCGHMAFTKFIFICVENTLPYEVAVYELGAEYINLGKIIYRRALMDLQRAHEEDWPGYPEEIRVLEPPPYALRAFII